MWLVVGFFWNGEGGEGRGGGCETYATGECQGAVNVEEADGVGNGTLVERRVGLVSHLDRD
jgi:hypothetical protein